MSIDTETGRLGGVEKLGEGEKAGTVGRQSSREGGVGRLAGDRAAGREAREERGAAV